MATTELHAAGVQADDLQALLDGHYVSLRHLHFAPAELLEQFHTAQSSDHQTTERDWRQLESVAADAFGIPDHVPRAPIGLL